MSDATTALAAAQAAAASSTTASEAADFAVEKAVEVNADRVAAGTSESNAASSAASASTSATTATTKASEASTSAATATTKASEASTSAATATTKAAEASTSATQAQGYASSAAGSVSLVAWAPATVYAAGDVRQAPDGTPISRIADGTSRATFDATEEAAWTSVLAKSGTLAQRALSATYAQVLTAISGETATATTARLNTALAAGSAFGVKKVVRLVGDFTTNAPLVIKSKTTLDATSATVTLAPGSNCRIVQNESLLGSGARDTDVHIKGGYWDRGANAGTGFNLFGICFHRADRISVTDARFNATAGKYACYYVDVTEATAERLEFNTESDGLHITGPASRITVRDIFGATHDDLVSFTGRDYTTYELTAGGGDISHVLVENVTHKGGDGNTVKLLPGASKVMSNVTVRGVKGTPDLQAVTLYSDTNQASTTGGTIRNVTIEDVSGAPLSGIWVQVHGVTVDGMQVRDLKLDKADGIRGVATGTGATVSDMLVDGVTTIAGYTGDVVHVGSGTTVTDLRVANVSAKLATLGIVYVSGTVGALHMQGITQLGGTGPALSIAAGGSVASFDLDGLHSTAAYGLLHQGSTPIEMSVARVTSLPTTVLARLNAAGSSLVLRADRVTGTASSLFSRSGTQTVRAIGATLRCDVSTLTPVAGDLAFNTNAALSCGVGPVKYDGATWNALGSAVPAQIGTAVSWYRCPVGVGVGTNQLGTGTLRLVPFIVPLAETISRLTCEVTTAGEAGSVVRLGIYSIDPAVGLPAALVLDAGTIDASSTGVKEITVSQALPAGQYALCAVTQNVVTTQPTLRSMTMGTGFVSRPTVGTDARSGWSLAGVTGALPSTLTGLGDTGIVPLMYVRRSA